MEFPLEADSSTSLWDLGNGGRKCYDPKIPFHFPQLSFFLSDAVVPGQGQQPQVPVAGM